MPYIGKKPADIIATAVDTTTGDFSGNVTAGGTLAVTGETTLATHLNLGDNDKIKLGASGDLEIFHDGSKSVISDEGTGVLWIAGDSEVSIGNPAVTEYYIRAFKDGAVQLMHDNSTKFATSSGGVTVTGDIANTSGDLTIDVASNIILDADGGVVRFYDGGTQIGNFANNSSDFHINVSTQDKDFSVNGNDGGSTFTAFTLDMSDGGAATFAKGITLTNGNIAVANGNGIDFSAASGSASGSSSAVLDDYEEGTFTPGLIDSGGGLGANLTTQVGQYTKVGNLVTFVLRINGDARTSTSNQVYITNLPFTFSPASSVNRIQFEVNGINLGLDSGFYSLNGQLANTDTSLTILMQGTSVDNFRGHDLTPSYEIYVSGSYFTS